MLRCCGECGVSGAEHTMPVTSRPGLDTMSGAVRRRGKQAGELDRLGKHGPVT